MYPPSLRQIVFMDAEPTSCSTFACDSLPEFLRAQPMCGTLQVCTPGTLPVDATPPYLALARFSAAEPVTEALLALTRKWRETRVIGLVCGGWGTASESLRELLHTLDDFILCPFRPVELVERIRRMLPPAGTPSHGGAAVRENLKLDFLVGNSRPFLDLIQSLPLLAASDAPVLITGETGTGKELFARAIHYSSARRGRGFIPVNCGALPDQLFENEIFGHMRGAYTGAAGTQKGLIAAAEGGTLFLDEVDALTPAAQVKLLRFLQDREYRPLGSVQTLTADVRIIAATNADLRRKMELTQLREDLFHRLNLLPLHIPPLRDREEDVALLAEHILRKYAIQYGRGRLTFAPGVVRRLAAHSWPGNVRELEGVIHRTVVMTEADVLRSEDLGLPDVDCAVGETAPSLREAKSRQMADFERVYLREVLGRNNFNVTQAAREAQTDRRAFQRLMRKHDIGRRCG